MNDIIICRLDGKEMLTKHLAKHLKIYHKKNYKEYIKEYIDDFKPRWNLCPICNSVVKGKVCSGKCLSQYYSDIRKGIPLGPMSEETKKKLSDDRKQKYSNGWAPRIGKLHSEESKKKNSLSHIGKKLPSISGELNPACRPEIRKKISETRIERGIAKGEKNGMFGKTHTPETIKKIFSYRKMNKLEKLVADELDKAGVGYHFQYFVVENDICKSYDFKIKETPLILEIDGNYWHGNPDQTNHYKKVDEVKKNDILKEELASRKGLKVIRLWESDVKKDPSIVMRTLNLHIYSMK